jgi:hypothetical protein
MEGEKTNGGGGHSHRLESYIGQLSKENITEYAKL